MARIECAIFIYFFQLAHSRQLPGTDAVIKVFKREKEHLNFHYTPKEEAADRITKLKSSMKNKGMDALEEGMAFVVEPKIVFPGEGSVGLENTVVVTHDGYDILTPLEQDILTV